MYDQGPLVITGASGTVGSCLIEHLSAIWSGRLCVVGRTRPARLRPGDTFIQCDLAHAASTGRAGKHLTAGPPVAALVCAAGTDSRAGLYDLDPDAFAECMQVNCLGNLQLLRAAVESRPLPAAVFPVVLVSSDVVGQRMARTGVYAAAKAAAEEAFRHATADLTEPGAALLLVRLPYIGVPMRAAVPGPTPPQRMGSHRPLPILITAVEAITDFVVDPRPTAGVEVWHA